MLPKEVPDTLRLYLDRKIDQFWFREDIRKVAPVEERVYRMRCVEAWSMVIPWAGYPRAKLLDRVQPTSAAKYVAFTTLLDSTMMPGQKADVLQWPYVEGLRTTPVMSILRELTDRCWPGKIDLVFSVQSPSDVIFADELRLLASRHQNLRVLITVTREAPTDWAGLKGRITGELLKRIVPDVATRPAFVCGPNSMAAAVRDELLALGVPADRITLESFTPAAATPAQDERKDQTPGAAAATVTFVRSRRSAPLPARKTILDAAESVGVPIDFQCRSGICGTCRCKLLSGHVTMPVRDALGDADEAEGYILACQARATEDVMIDA